MNTKSKAYFAPQMLVSLTTDCSMEFPSTSQWRYQLPFIANTCVTQRLVASLSITTNGICNVRCSHLCHLMELIPFTCLDTSLTALELLVCTLCMLLFIVIHHNYNRRFIVLFLIIFPKPDIITKAETKNSDKNLFKYDFDGNLI